MRQAFGVTVTSTAADGRGIGIPRNTEDPISAPTAVVAALAVVDANTATLVGQGATPLEATVTTLAANVALLDAAVAALVLVSSRSDVMLSWDLDKVPTRSALGIATRKLLVATQASGNLTP